MPEQHVAVEEVPVGAVAHTRPDPRLGLDQALARQGLHGLAQHRA
jgi:hypothetical protein